MRAAVEKIVFGCFFVFLSYLVFEGVIRYLFAAIDANFAVYIPKIVLLSIIIMYLFMYGKVHKMTWYYILLLLLYMSIGIFNIGFKQGVFGLWVLVPIIYGMIFSGSIYRSEYYYWYLCLFLLCVTGVLIGPFVHYPWAGLEVNIMGKDISASIAWESMGLNREAGFSRASYNAAAQLMGLSVLIVYLSRSLYAKIFIWVLCGIGVALTTTKGAFAAWIFLSVYYFLYYSLRESSLQYVYRSLVVTVFSVICVILPLTTFIHVYEGVPNGKVMTFFLGSFMDRLVRMWPDSFNLLENGDLSTLYFGRGVGGIGAAQSYYEPEFYRAADNMFVYMTVNFGLIISVMFMIYIVYKAFSGKGKYHHLYVVPVIILLLIYGLVANIIEEPFLSILLGTILLPYQNIDDYTADHNIQYHIHSHNGLPLNKTV